MRTHPARSIACTLLIASLAPLASGIVIRDDVPDSEYQALAAQSQFAAAGRMIFNTGSGNFFGGSATLIAPGWVLTAAHVADNQPASAWRFDLGSSASRVSVAEVFIHPDWGGDDQIVNGSDFALMRLASPITSVTPASISRRPSPAPGTDIVHVGFGGTGTGTTGFTSSSPVVKRAATNVLEATDFFTPFFHYCDFDNPANGGATPLEGQLAPGDSGGPIFANFGGSWEILGVHSFIADWNNDGILANYGDIMASNRIEPFISWIDGIIPAPGTAIPLGLGVLIVARRRR
jgi:secreted trypsin-like serine protease